MAKKTVNKDAQNNFLQLDVSEQIERLNKVLESNGTTDGISELGFSYTWIQKKMEEQGVYYVSSLKKFIVNGGSFTNIEIIELREILKDYMQFRESKNNVDIRLCAGACGVDSITRSIVVDKTVNEEWCEFTKENSFINSKDLYTMALKEFLRKYINKN